MVKCPKCGSSVEGGMKFCGECGTPIPQTKECPKCHALCSLATKFCGECGHNFNAASSSGAPLIGDKNVIAGDVRLDQSSTINNTTHNYISQDETRHLVQCVVCERQIVVTESRTCRECHHPVCAEHYDVASGLCATCASKKASDAEAVYRKELEVILEDGIIDRDEFDQLEVLRGQLGLSAPRAMELQKQMKADLAAKRTASKGEAPLMLVERAQCERAKELLFDSGNGREAVRLLESIYRQHPLSEEVLSVYLAALFTYDEDRAKSIISSLPVDMVRAYLVLFDIEMKHGVEHGDLAAAEVKLAKAETLWPENMLLKCRRVELMYASAIQMDNRTFLAEAMDLCTSLGDPTDKLEKSWQAYVKLLISQALGDEIPSLTPAYCREQGYYHALVTGQFTGIQVIDEKELYARCLRGRDFGAGVFPSVTKAEYKVLNCAAQRGELQAALIVGDCYLDPEGNGVVVPNEEEALRWYTRAAEGGLADAQFMVGACYENGMGCTADGRQALAWYRKAAEQGFPDAVERLSQNEKTPVEETVAAIKPQKEPDIVPGDQAKDESCEKDSEERAPDAPMDVGRIRMVVKNVLKKHKCDDIYFPGHADFNKKWRNFTAKAAENLELFFAKKEAIALMDCTVFGSGKNGVLFEDAGICVMNGWIANAVESGFVPWNEFVEKGEFTIPEDLEVLILKDGELKIGVVAPGGDLSAEEVVNIFTEIQDELKKGK